MMEMPQEFLIGEKICEKKYVFTSDYMDFISICPKNRIISAWELKKDKKGLLPESLKNNNFFSNTPLNTGTPYLHITTQHFKNTANQITTIRVQLLQLPSHKPNYDNFDMT